MKFGVLRLVAAAALFIGWIGYLTFLAATVRNPVVLSRPQFLVAQRDVIATYKGGLNFTIDEVLYPKSAADDKGKTVSVRDLKDCQTFSPQDGWHAVPPTEGQRYLLPLQSAAAPDQPEAMNVVPIPPSPGYAEPGPPRIYPDTPEVRREYGALPKP